MKDLSRLDASALETVASQWIARRDRGLTAAEEEELARWLVDPRHTEVLSRCEAVWRALPKVGGIPAEELDQLAALRRRRLAPALWLPVMAAAAAAIVLGVRSVRLPARDHFAAQTYAAPAAAERRLELPDRSVAILHRGSRIAFGSFVADRRVRLLAGEVLITVAKTSAHPFLLEAGPVTIRDLGTAFDVRIAPHRVSILVTEGLVELRPGAKTSAAGGDSPIRLGLWQQAVVSSAASPAVEVRTLTSREVGQTLRWKSHELAFDRTPLSEVVAELNRYNVRQISLADPSQGAVLISGAVRSDDLRVFLQLLQSGFGFQADRGGGEIVLRRAK